ncbi:hypothetical protein XMIN_2266 [Xanthomonas citri pv. mangiferaeindicae LMG 941]|nr:hypothetical protein XMIN_2266 [Xanthomonas citri pv. mangiferaeindicae LMG 941]
MLMDGGQSLGKRARIRAGATMPLGGTRTRRSVPARDQASSVIPRRAQARSYMQQAISSSMRNVLATNANADGWWPVVGKASAY